MVSFALLPYDLVVDPALRDVSVERGPAGDAQRLIVPIDVWNALLPGDKRRIYEQVIAGAVEAWREDGCIVFHHARLPLHAAARRWHAARVAFLLERVAE